jgi:site-specific DNA-methyltransferase (adenine-specific)
MPQKRTPSTRRPRRWRIEHADCLLALPKLAPDSIDVVITDPPYGINFKSMRWDQPSTLDPTHASEQQASSTDPSSAFQAFSAQWSSAALRVLKPGGHLAAFAAPRTFHLLARGLEEAGFELRDTLMWIQGQGYPATRVLSGGLGTGLKPAWEPILLARRPFEGNVEHNLAEHGTGALNIDTCRIELSSQDCPGEGRTHTRKFAASRKGRWPANLLLSHGRRCTSSRCERDCPIRLLGDRHRFFYAAKAPRREREAGCEQLPRRVVQTFKVGAHNVQLCEDNPVANIHPTVKPIELMRWLVRLLTPPGGLVLDPFAGSGSTGAAAVLEGARFLGIEREGDYIPIARARIKYWTSQAQSSRTTEAARQSRT